MIDTKLLIEYAKQPDLALQNLSELMDQLESEDETIQNYSSEALENCGAPRSEDIEKLLQLLESGGTQQLYWASTLIGRLGAHAKKTSDFDHIQKALCRVAANAQLELPARERAAWALSEIGPIHPNALSILRPLVPVSPPRLKRLLESAISKSI